jgi:predicted DNA-binding protein (UPF0251 family)
MAIPSWFDNLLHSGTAAGLSGIPSLQLSANPDRDWYLRFLRSHFTTMSLVRHPERLWGPSGSSKRGSGLESHLLSLAPEGMLSASQLVVILSQAELDEALDLHGSAWVEQVESELQSQVDQLVFQRKLRSARGSGLQVRIVRDGERLLGGRVLNLLPGEFVSAMLPNRHVGPPSPRLGVYVHIPGVFEGFRPATPVQADQLLYTFGTHWLDNFSHPALGEAALYQLRRDAQGRWIHSIHPDHRENFVLKRTAQNGAMDVLTLCDSHAKPLLDVQLVALERTLDGVHSVSAEPTSPISIVPEEESAGLMSLEECAVLLQKVHFPQVMKGYEVYLSEDGGVSTHVDGMAAILEVRDACACLLSKSKDLKVNGAPLEMGERIALEGLCEIEIGENRLFYKDLSRVNATGWPYLGEIRRGGWQSHLPLGGRYTIGRDPSAWVRLPDMADNRNIRWSDESATSSVTSKTGTFARKDFYTDSIMVASEHAVIDLSQGATLENKAKHCHVYVRRASAIVSLMPTRKSGLHQFQIRAGDELLVGNCVFTVGGQVPVGLDQTAPGL